MNIFTKLLKLWLLGKDFLKLLKINKKLYRNH